MAADLYLSVGVEGGSSLKAGSGQRISETIDKIMANINKKPHKVTITADISKEAIRKSLSTAVKEVNDTKKPITITVKEFKADGAIKGLKTKLNKVIDNLSLEKGVSITLNASELGEIKDDAVEAARQVDKALAETQQKVLRDQQKATDAIRSRMMKSRMDTGDEYKEQDRSYIDWLARINVLKKANAAISDEQLQGLIKENEIVRDNLLVIEAIARLERERAEKSDVAAPIDEKLIGQGISLRNQLEKSINDYTAAKFGKSHGEYAEIQGLSDEILKLNEEYRAHEITQKQYKKRLDEIRTRYRELTGEIKKNNEATKTFSQRIAGLAEKFATWFSLSRVIMGIVSNIRQMITYVTSLDTAMTELRKVTDETSDTYLKFFDEAIVRAKQLGATVTDTISATADFARLGYGIGDAAELADAALVYKNVGDGIEDVATASESIISTMKAFGVEANQAMLIVDKFNEVGKMCPSVQ